MPGLGGVVLEYDIFSDFDDTTISGANGAAIYSNQLQFFVTAVPEPSTVGLLAGVASLVVAARFRRRRAARL